MNPQNQTNQTQTGNTFASQQSSQTNPFTADLKGEFTSDFGTRTNAVSQIFKDGGFSSGNNVRWILLGILAVVAIVAAFFLLSESEPEISFDDPAKVAEEKPADPATTTPAEQAPATEAAAPAADAASTTEAAPKSAVGSGTIALTSPADGESRAYDETSEPARFKWEGGAATIVFSRNRSMQPVYMRVPVSGSSYSFYNPYPGTWYWRVENESGQSEARSFTIEAPVRRNVAIKEPVGGAALAANGGTIAWTGDTKVAFYRVEFSTDGKFASPAYRFASSGEQVKTQGMNPGTYQMRVGAFSEVSGRWEYTDAVTVNVQ